MKWLRRLWRKWNGWYDCPVCKEQTLEFIKFPIFHPEEPPCFGHWQCCNPKCKVQTDIAATPLMDQAARDHGYQNFDDFLQKKG